LVRVLKTWQRQPAFCSVFASNNLASFARAGDTHLIAVFGYRPTRKSLTFRCEDRGDPVVRQGFARVFGFDHLLDPKFDDASRDFFAVIVHHSLGEKAAQLYHSLWRVRVFAVYDTRNGREMHAEVFRDILKHHWLDVFDAAIEEVALAFDDPLADAIDCLFTMLDVFQQIDC